MIAAAAYQSGETLFSQYTGTWESGEHQERIVHKDILLPPNAPREYADRQTLWNAVDAAEKARDAQTARRFIIALPKELTMEQNIELIRQYCQSTFVDKGMIADIAVHFNHEEPPNPHAHVLLTMRSMDEHGKWQAKARSEYVLDENGDRIIGKNGKPKRIKIETVDWNDRGKCEEWRHEWEVQQNRALEASERPERIDMRSFERQGIEMTPQKHLGPAASALEKQGIRTRLGDHNSAVRVINSLFNAIKRRILNLSEWLKGLSETISDHEKIESPYDYPIADVLKAYVDLRAKEREGWYSGAQSKSHIRDMSEMILTCDYLRDHNIETVHDFSTKLNQASQSLEEKTGVSGTIRPAPEDPAPRIRGSSSEKEQRDVVQPVFRDQLFDIPGELILAAFEQLCIPCSLRCLAGFHQFFEFRLFGGRNAADHLIQLFRVQFDSLLLFHFHFLFPLYVYQR